MAINLNQNLYFYHCALKAYLTLVPNHYCDLVAKAEFKHVEPKSTMMEFKRIEPKSALKIGGIALAVFGFILGLVVSVVGVGSLGTSAGTGLPGGVAGDVVIIVELTIVYGILGAVGGYVFALVYNTAAKNIGGVVIELQEK
jgi:hypothetical protein